MTPLSKRYREKVAFDEKDAEKTRFERGVDMIFGQNKDTGERCKILFTDGAEYDAEKRKPIDQAVAELLDALESKQPEYQGMNKDKIPQYKWTEHERVNTALRKLSEALK